MAISQTSSRYQLPPSAPWDSIRAEIRKKWAPDEHFSIFGLTGSGKTVLELTLVNDRIADGKRVVILGTKPRDAVLTAWIKKHRAAQVPSLDKLRIMDRNAKAIVVWPKYGMPRDQKAAIFAATIQRIVKKGDITVVLDEAIYLIEQMGLRREVDELYHAGRSSGVPVLANSQRPTWVAKGMATQPDWLVNFRTNDLNDRKSFAGIMGDPTAKEWLREIPYHQFVIARPNRSNNRYLTHLSKEQAKAI